MSCWFVALVQFVVVVDWFRRMWDGDVVDGEVLTGSLRKGGVPSWMRLVLSLDVL